MKFSFLRCGVRRLALHGALLLLGLSQAAGADAVRGIVGATNSPLAMRGGILLLPLRAQTPGDQWPTTLQLQLDSGTMINGIVGWVFVDETPRPTHWTDDPRRLAIRPIHRLDDSSALPTDSTLGPVLLARLPRDGWGPIRLEQQVLSPRWIDPSPASGPRTTRMTVPRQRTPEFPDSDCPLNAWRWALLADAQGQYPPELSFDEVESMVAEYQTTLWRWGLARIHKVDETLSGRCMQSLTRRCADRGRAIAAWAADPDALNRLLAILLSDGVGNERLIGEVRNWLENQPSLLFWTESEATDHIRLVTLNATSRPVVARFTWIHTPDVPIAVPIDPGVLMRVRIDRVQPRPDDLAALARPNETHQLLIESGDLRYRLDFRPPTVPVHPPGLSWPSYLAPVTLAELQQRRQRVVADSHATTTQLRRREGRWEIFFECRRPARAGEAAIRPRSVLDLAEQPAEVIGIETVTLLIGPDDKSGVALTIPERGEPRFFRGTDDGTLQIHRRSFRDRWLCRLVLPQGWLLPSSGPFISFGAFRTHADLNQVDTSPHASVPWRVTSGRLAVDLSLWSDLPEVRDSGTAR